MACEEVTAQSDLYSLGLMLFEMLTGSHPYRARDQLSMMHMQLRAPTPALPASCAALQPLVDGLMHKQPSGRYPSAQALLADLLAFTA